MHIIRHYNDCPEEAKGSVAALGNFDGVHLGHKIVIEKAVSIAKEKSLSSAVLTFEPHPLSILRPESGPVCMTPFRDKYTRIKALGIDYMFALHFTHNFSLITAEEFIKDIIIDSLSIKHIVVGHDFSFGHKRGGNIDLLKKLSKEYDYEITQLDAVADGSEIFSSTKIRNHLKDGNISEASRMLGHDYVIHCRVVRGKARGKDLGFPTANLNLKKYLRPAFGIYIALVTIEDESELRPAAVNIGRNPTFEDDKELLEVHILDYDGDLYGKKLRVKLIEYIRPEKKFDDIEQLKVAIKDDCQKVRNYFDNIKAEAV